MNQDLLLCTDLDRTLLPNGKQTESSGARDLFSKLAAHPNVCLVFVTGRHKELVQQAIEDYSLPAPDLVISDVGTCIYDLRTRDWQTWQDWDTEIAPDWTGFTHADLYDLFQDISPLKLQEHEKQNAHKLSYYVSLHENETELIRLMQQRLLKNNINASLIWSIDETANIGLLDVLPKNATKYHAIQFLRKRLGVSLDNTLFAGDSGNDLQVLTSEIPSILVANATDDIRQSALTDMNEYETQDVLYCAQGGYLGMNGNYSAGILEGVAHFKPELGHWLTDMAKQKNAG